MKNKPGEHLHNPRNMNNALLGLLIGSLTGAAVMLLFARQSGRQIRSWLNPGSILMRDRLLTKPIPAVPGTRIFPIAPAVTGSASLSAGGKIPRIRRSSLIHFRWMPPPMAYPQDDLPRLGHRQGEQNNTRVLSQPSSSLLKTEGQLLIDDRLENDSLGG